MPGPAQPDRRSRTQSRRWSRAQSKCPGRRRSPTGTAMLQYQVPYRMPGRQEPLERTRNPEGHSEPSPRQPSRTGGHRSWRAQPSVKPLRLRFQPGSERSAPDHPRQPATQSANQSVEGSSAHPLFEFCNRLAGRRANYEPHVWASNLRGRVDLPQRRSGSRLSMGSCPVWPPIRRRRSAPRWRASKRPGWCGRARAPESRGR